MIPIAHIGFTGVGSECATGQLLSSMLIEEGKFDLKVDISCLAAAESKSHVHMRSLFRAGTTELDISSVLAQISKFRIELLIVRLDPKFEIVGLEEIKKQLGCKIVVSIMDVVGYGDSIITPIKAADKLWFISESLACSYLDLAGDQDYFFSANGVSQDWRRSDTFVVRKIPLKIGFFWEFESESKPGCCFFIGARSR